MEIGTVTASSCTRLHLDDYHPESELPKSDPVTSKNKSQGKSSSESLSAERAAAELLRHSQLPGTSLPAVAIGLGRPRHSLPHGKTGNGSAIRTTNIS